MRLPFCILTVRGDVLADGELHFVEAARTLVAARRRVDALAKSWPAQYVIYNAETGERLLAQSKTAVGMRRVVSR